MRETSKAHPRRLTCGDFDLYLRGNGIDVGAGDDPLVVPFGHVRTWDKADGDAQILSGVDEKSFDFVYSSHCLEHMQSVEEALATWAKVCRIDGYVYVVVPEWTLYEHRQWPSRHNRDHRASFALISTPSVDHRHYTLADLIRIGRRVGLELADVRLDMEGFDCKLHTTEDPFIDQTRRGAQAQLTVVWRKID